MALTDEFKNITKLFTSVIKEEIEKVDLKKVNENVNSFIDAYTHSSLTNVRSALYDMLDITKIEISLEGVLPKLEGGYTVELRVKKLTSTNLVPSTLYTVSKEMTKEKLSQVIQDILYNDFIFYIPLTEITSTSVTGNNTLYNSCVDSVITEKFANVVPLSLTVNSKEQRILLDTSHKNYSVMGTRTVELLPLDNGVLADINSAASVERNTDLISLLDEMANPFVTHNNRVMVIENADSTYYKDSFDIKVYEAVTSTRTPDYDKYNLVVKYDSSTGILTTLYKKIVISAKPFNMYDMNIVEYSEWKEDVIVSLHEYFSLMGVNTQK